MNNSVDYKLEKFNELNRDSDDLLYKYATLESDIYRSFIIDYDNYIFYREYNKKNGYKYDHDNSVLNGKYDSIKNIYNYYEIRKDRKSDEKYRTVKNVFGCYETKKNSEWDKRVLENLYINLSHDFDVQNYNKLLDSDKALVKKKK